TCWLNSSTTFREAKSSVFGRRMPFIRRILGPPGPFGRNVLYAAVNPAAIPFRIAPGAAYTPRPTALWARRPLPAAWLWRRDNLVAASRISSATASICTFTAGSVSYASNLSLNGMYGDDMTDFRD